MSLNCDLIKEILGHVDGITLANAGCVSSDFWSIAKQENIWEEVCCSLWPSTKDKDVKELISSSLGGFRNFYANCFPLIACEGDFNLNEVKCLGDGNLDLHTSVPSDFVSVVDVAFKNKVIYSKVVWGIPDDFVDWFCNCPFRMDLISFSDVEDTWPVIFMSDDSRGKDGKFWGQLMDNIRLSWIVVNKRTGQAVNLSSLDPLAGQKDWLSDNDFVIRFGSILPAHNILPCKVVQCIFEIKCRGLDSDHGSLKITELSMKVEDMMGTHVNGKNSMLILERALGCRKSKNHDHILDSYRKCLTEQCKSTEANMRSEDRLDSICIISGILAFASFWYFVFGDGGALLGF